MRNFHQRGPKNMQQISKTYFWNNSSKKTGITKKQRKQFKLHPEILGKLIVLKVQESAYDWLFLQLLFKNEKFGKFCRKAPMSQSPFNNVAGLKTIARRCSVEKSVFRSSHQRHSVKKLFLKLSQNSKKKYLFRHSITGIFLWILRKFYEHFFTKRLWTTASVLWKNISYGTPPDNCC